MTDGGHPWRSPDPAPLRRPAPYRNDDYRSPMGNGAAPHRRDDYRSPMGNGAAPYRSDDYRSPMPNRGYPRPGGQANGYARQDGQANGNRGRNGEGFAPPHGPSREAHAGPRRPPAAAFRDHLRRVRLPGRGPLQAGRGARGVLPALLPRAQAAVARPFTPGQW